MSQTTAQIAANAIPAAKKPRLAFVGTGWIGLNRMKAIVESGLGQVCAIIEPQNEMALRAREFAPGAAVVPGFDGALRGDVDGVVIATPSALHADQAIAALENGCAVFCQKPLARTKQETDRVIDAARAADRLLGVDLSYRFTAAARAIRELIQNRELGELFAVELAFHNAYGPDKQWFYDPRLSGGGCLIDLGIHLVDLALWLLDFPHVESVSGKLFAKGRGFRGRGAETEDFAQATICLAPCTNVQLACSWRAHAGQDALIEATVYGTRGGAKLRNVAGSFYDFVAEHCVGTARHTIATPPDDWGGRAATTWLKRLSKSNRFDPDIERLSAVADVVDRVYAA